MIIAIVTILKATRITKNYPKNEKRKKTIAVVGDSMVKKIYGSAYSNNKNCVSLNSVLLNSISGAET